MRVLIVDDGRNTNALRDALRRKEFQKILNTDNAIKSIDVELELCYCIKTQETNERKTGRR